MTPLPQVRIETRPLSALQPAPYNPRRISREALDGLRASIQRFGLVQPIIVNERTGHVVGGHQRLRVLQEAGESAVQVVIVDLLEAEERALNVSLNNPHIAGEFTEDLDGLLAALRLEEPDLFDDLRLDALLAENGPPPSGNGDPDEVPELQEQPISKTGDLWLLGNHRLLVGDATEMADVTRLVGGDVVDLVITDPPYNVDYEGAAGRIQNDAMAADAFRAFLLAAFHAAIEVTKPGGCAYIFHADTNGHDFRTAFIEAGWSLRQCLVWVKGAATLSRQDYNWQHEPVLYGWRPGAAHYFCGDFTQTTVLNADKPARSELHPTMKPVELIERLVRNSSRRGEVVLDLFGGSGTTLIVCERNGRAARLVEIDPRFADVIVRRWQEYAGRGARLDGSLSTFEEVATERRR